MALTTLPSVKTALGITGAADDVLLTQLIEQADTLIKSYLRQNIEQATYTEFFGGNGSNQLILRQRPVISITSVHLDNDGYFGDGSDAFAAGDLLTAGTDYALYRRNATSSPAGILFRLNGNWPAASQRIQGLLAQGITDGIGNIKVVYIAGYATVPKDIQLAANQMVAVLKDGATRGGPMESQSLDYYSYTLASGDAGGNHAIGSIKQILSRYREWVI